MAALIGTAASFLFSQQVKMIERPPDFSESDFQEALQRIESLEMIANRLVAAIEGKEERELGFALRFAKTALDVFKKKPITH